MDSTYPESFYCSTCWAYIGPTGKRLPYTDDDAIVWVEECPHCLGRRLVREAAEEEKRRPRVCELDGCDELFVPATRWQAFCCDQHRWRAHRLAKAALVVEGVGSPGRP